jgi:hypothetical protein
MVAAMRRLRLSCLAIGVVCAIAALGETPAQASTVTIGSTETAGVTSSAFGSPGSVTLANLTLGAPWMTVSSPVNGVITRWRITDASGGPFYLRVIRSSAAGQFIGVGTSAPATPVGSGIQTFSTNLPIQQGDLIGLDTSHASDETGALVRPGSTIAGWVPVLPNGAPTVPTVTAAGELVLSADIQPVPSVAGISPSSGSIIGGTNVTITGADLGGATMVRLGDQPAAVFPGRTDTQITAIAPRVKKPGPVAVTVETIAGSSPIVPGATFTYAACVVPKLEGKTVKAARKKLKRAGCKLGKVNGQGKKVAGQGFKPRADLPPGKKVNVRLG